MSTPTERFHAGLLRIQFGQYVPGKASNWPKPPTRTIEQVFADAARRGQATRNHLANQTSGVSVEPSAVPAQHIKASIKSEIKRGGKPRMVDLRAFELSTKLSQQKNNGGSSAGKEYPPTYASLVSNSVVTSDQNDTISPPTPIADIDANIQMDEWPGLPKPLPLKSIAKRPAIISPRVKVKLPMKQLAGICNTKHAGQSLNIKNSIERALLKNQSNANDSDSSSILSCPTTPGVAEIPSPVSIVCTEDIILLKDWPELPKPISSIDHTTKATVAAIHPTTLKFPIMPKLAATESQPAAGKQTLPPATDQAPTDLSVAPSAQQGPSIKGNERSSKQSKYYRSNDAAIGVTRFTIGGKHFSNKPAIRHIPDPAKVTSIIPIAPTTDSDGFKYIGPSHSALWKASIAANARAKAEKAKSLAAFEQREQRRRLEEAAASEEDKPVSKSAPATSPCPGVKFRSPKVAPAHTGRLESTAVLSISLDGTVIKAVNKPASNSSSPAVSTSDSIKASTVDLLSTTSKLLGLSSGSAINLADSATTDSSTLSNTREVSALNTLASLAVVIPTTVGLMETQSFCSDILTSTSAVPASPRIPDPVQSLEKRLVSRKEMEKQWKLKKKKGVEAKRLAKASATKMEQQQLNKDKRIAELNRAREASLRLREEITSICLANMKLESLQFESELQSYENSVVQLHQANVTRYMQEVQDGKDSYKKAQQSFWHIQEQHQDQNDGFIGQQICNTIRTELRNRAVEHKAALAITMMRSDEQSRGVEKLRQHIFESKKKTFDRDAYYKRFSDPDMFSPLAWISHRKDADFEQDYPRPPIVISTPETSFNAPKQILYNPSAQEAKSAISKPLTLPIRSQLDLSLSRRFIKSKPSAVLETVIIPATVAENGTPAAAVMYFEKNSNKVRKLSDSSSSTVVTASSQQHHARSVSGCSTATTVDEQTEAMVTLPKSALDLLMTRLDGMQAQIDALTARIETPVVSDMIPPLALVSSPCEIYPAVKTGNKVDKIISDALSFMKTAASNTESGVAHAAVLSETPNFFMTLPSRDDLTKEERVTFLQQARAINALANTMAVHASWIEAEL